MGGLIWNDLYNIGHNAKQMLLIVIVWGVCFYSGAEGGAYILMFSVLFSMMIVTAFSFDEKCGWTKYAMILPVKRQEYVIAKYITNTIFSLMGCLLGVILTIFVSIIKGNVPGELIIYCGLMGVSLALVLGSMFITLLLKYGSEKARVIMLGVIAIPVLLGFLLQEFVGTFPMDIWEKLSEWGIYLFPVAALLILGITMAISIHIFEKKEF